MKALSIRQPWAWLIVNGHKDIENRSWPTRFRGPVLIHAAKGMTMSSTKSATGHLLGAAGAIESAFAVLAIRDQIAPPTINLDNPSVETEIDLVPNKAKPMKIDVALSNSFGFGGTNASVVFKKVT